MATKVSLSFGKLGDFEFDNFAQGVIDAITGNAAFPTPPVTIANLQAARDDLTAKMAAAQTGGPPETAAKHNSRQTLTGMLRDVAAYVQIRCNDDPAILLSSGFEMQSTNRAQVELTQPQGLSLKNGGSGQLIGRVDPVKSGGMYEGRIRLNDGDWLPSVFSGDSQRILFTGLTPGTTYTIQARALGGSTGQSDWSDPSSHMSM